MKVRERAWLRSLDVMLFDYYYYYYTQTDDSARRTQVAQSLPSTGLSQLQCSYFL